MMIFEQPDVKKHVVDCSNPMGSEYWVNLECGTDYIFISVDSDEAKAYRLAAQKLRKLADECEAMAGME